MIIKTTLSTIGIMALCLHLTARDQSPPAADTADKPQSADASVSVEQADAFVGSDQRN